jgi:hypothetical protein
MFFFIRIVHLNILRVWRRAREACFVEGAYGTQDLFYAGTEAAYTRQTIVLRKSTSWMESVAGEMCEVGRTRRALFACSTASHGAGRSKKTDGKTLCAL